MALHKHFRFPPNLSSWQLAGAGWEVAAAGALLRQVLSVPEVVYRWLGRVGREEKLS